MMIEKPWGLLRARIEVLLDQNMKWSLKTLTLQEQAASDHCEIFSLYVRLSKNEILTNKSVYLWPFCPPRHLDLDLITFLGFVFYGIEFFLSFNKINNFEVTSNVKTIIHI